jgi:hypothetical protein
MSHQGHPRPPCADSCIGHECLAASTAPRRVFEKKTKILTDRLDGNAALFCAPVELDMMSDTRYRVAITVT